MKKELTKKGLSIISFFLILILVLMLLSYWFMPSKSEKHEIRDVIPNGLLAEEDNTIDVLFYGDSEAYTSFSPMQLWDERGFASFVCATSSQYISLTENFVHQSLEHQKPKVIVLEPYCFFRKMKADNSLITNIENTFSIIQYHNRWKNMIGLHLNDNQHYTWKDELKGYKFGSTVTKAKGGDYMKKTDEIIEIPETNVETVKRIVKYCNDRETEVLFVSVPSCKNWNYPKHRAVAELAKESGVRYVDLNLEKSVNIDWRKDSLDGGDHLNFRGAKKVCGFLGQYLSDTYHLENKSALSQYDDWNEGIEKYRLLVNENENG